MLMQGTSVMYAPEIKYGSLTVEPDKDSNSSGQANRWVMNLVHRWDVCSWMHNGTIYCKTDTVDWGLWCMLEGAKMIEECKYLPAGDKASRDEYGTKGRR